MNYDRAIRERHGTVEELERELYGPEKIPPAPKQSKSPTTLLNDVKKAAKKVPRPGTAGTCPACGQGPTECFIHGTFWKKPR